MEIMTRYLPAFLVAVFHAGIKLYHREFVDRRSGLPDKVLIVSQKRGHASQYRKKGGALDEDPDLHIALSQTVALFYKSTISLNYISEKGQKYYAMRCPTIV